MRTMCRRCESVYYPLTPEGYCYLCLSQFGVATQITMLLLGYNPALTVEELQRCLGLESRPVRSHKTTPGTSSRACFMAFVALAVTFTKRSYGKMKESRADTLYDFALSEENTYERSLSLDADHGQ